MTDFLLAAFLCFQFTAKVLDQHYIADVVILKVKKQMRYTR